MHIKIIHLLKEKRIVFKLLSVVLLNKKKKKAKTDRFYSWSHAGFFIIFTCIIIYLCSWCFSFGLIYGNIMQ